MNYLDNGTLFFLIKNIEVKDDTILLNCTNDSIYYIDNENQKFYLKLPIIYENRVFDYKLSMYLIDILEKHILNLELELKERKVILNSVLEKCKRILL
jgi:hypothetical protein